MKLPTYHSGAVQSLDTVDPSVYRELGRSQVQFAGALQGGAEALTDHYVKVSTADRLRGEAELRIKAQELNTFVERNENVPIDMVPKNLRTAQNTRTIVDEEGNTQQYIPSRLIAEDWRKQILGDEAKRISEGARTRLGKDWIRESWEMDIAPRSEAALSEIVYRQEEVAAQAEFEETGQALIDAGDAEGFVRHLEAGNVNNIIDEKQYGAARRQGLEKIQVNSYAELIRNPDTPTDILEEAVRDVETDKLISEAERTPLVKSMRAALYKSHENAVADAIIDGDYRVQALINEYGAKNYKGGITDRQREVLLTRLESYQKSQAATLAAQDKVRMTLDRERIATTLDGVKSGDLRVTDLGELIDLSPFTNNPKPTAADIKNANLTYTLLNNQQELAALAGVTAEERATYAATLPRSTHEERMYADWVEDYTAAIDKHLTEDSTTFAIRQGWYGDDQAFNSVASPVSDNLEEVLIARTQRNMNTRVKTGISSGPLTTEEAQVFAEYWRTASTDERLAMSERVSGAIGGGGLAFFKQLGKAVGDSSVAAGALATEQGATADDKESARLILDGQKVLADDTVKPFKNTGSVENQAYHLVAPLIGENFPGRRDAVIDSVVSYLAGKYTREGKSEQDPGKGTVQKAVAAVLGREVIKPDVNGFGLFGSGTSIIAPKGVNQRGWGKWLSDERFTKYIDESGGVAGYRSSYIQDGIKRGEIMLMPTDRDGEWLLTTDGRRALGNKTTGKHFRLKYSAGYTADGN